MICAVFVPSHLLETAVNLIWEGTYLEHQIVSIIFQIQLALNLKDQAHRDKTMGLKPRKTIDNTTDAQIIQMVKFQIQTQTA